MLEYLLLFDKSNAKGVKKKGLDAVKVVLSRRGTLRLAPSLYFIHKIKDTPELNQELSLRAQLVNLINLFGLKAGVCLKLMVRLCSPSILSLTEGLILSVIIHSHPKECGFLTANVYKNLNFLIYLLNFNPAT